MQIFLCEYNVVDAANALNYTRARAQMNNVKKALLNISDEERGFKNHQTIALWRGGEFGLLEYGRALNERVAKDSKPMYAWETAQRVYNTHFTDCTVYPQWFYDKEALERVVITHRGFLHTIAPDFYPQYEPESKIYRDYVCCDKCAMYVPLPKHGYGG